MRAIYKKILGLQDRQSVVYAAAITPDPSRGRVIVVGALTGNITVNNPPTAYVPDIGDCVEFLFTANATGRQITYGSQYRAGTVPASTASQRARQSFRWDGTAWITAAPLVWFTA
jgi:hypothetical protein